jgi:hypothetical protein
MDLDKAEAPLTAGETQANPTASILQSLFSSHTACRNTASLIVFQRAVRHT